MFNKKYSPLDKVHKSDHIMYLLHTKLWFKVLIGLALGLIAGVILGPDFGIMSADATAILTSWLALPGNIFLQVIKMIVIPLIFSSIVLGVISSGNVNFLKKIAPRVCLYFIATTTVAVLIGFGVSFLINPGTFIGAEQVAAMTSGVKPISTVATAVFSLTELPVYISSLIPSNPFKAMVAGDMLAVVIFSIISGVGLLFSKKRHINEAKKLLEVIQDVSMRVVKWAMHLAPIAVFGLIVQVISKIGFSVITGLGIYILTVLLGLFLLLVFYNLLVFVVSKMTPRKFMGALKSVQLLAFSTSSSAAVMPLSLKTSQEKLNVEPAVSDFLIPVGATVNMDGTALYQAVATVFLAQVFSVELSLAGLFMIVLITVGASIGAPAVPGVGIVILATILESAGIPGVGIALILGVDRIIDMCRTAINVTGDLTACVVFNKQAKRFMKK